jgi:hypothetical protein
MSTIQTNSRSESSNKSNSDINNSSPVATNEYTFLSKDRLYYKTYTDYVAANVRHNHKVLKEKGLDQTSFRIVAARIRSTTRNTNSNKRRLPYDQLESDDTNIKDAKRQTRSSSQRSCNDDGLFRRSSRLKNTSELTMIVGTTNKRSVVTPDTSVSSSSVSSMLDDDETHSVDFRSIPNKKPRRIAPFNTVSKSSFLLPGNNNTEFTKDEMQLLKNVSADLWMDDMDRYLNDVEGISKMNRVSVMRQITKLVSGVGITYHHWPAGTYFYKHKFLNLSTELNHMYQTAIDYENQYGRDLGNGTLL